VIEQFNVYLLLGFKNRAPNSEHNKPSGYILLAPTTVTKEVAHIAWTDAVRRTADGFDIPNYAKAAARLIEYHPSWRVIQTAYTHIDADMSITESDQPDKP
jgi:hypothetical protein